MNSVNKRLMIKAIAVGIILLLLIYLMIKLFHKNPPPSVPAPPVIVQKPVQKKMAEYITQTGTTVAYQSVNLVARVEGYLQAIHFTDGTFVKKGMELFTLEPDPYQEQLAGARATVAAQKANLAYAQIEHARQKQMYRDNATSLNSVQIWLAKKEEAQAEVEKAEASAKSAEINYSYTHILAPFDGRMSRHLVDVGNLVGNGKATDLATIEQIDPIYVYFNLNELDLIKVRAAARAHGLKPSDIHQIPVHVGMQNEKGFPHMGHLDFVNTGLNASTGTMEFRALLSNKDFALLPGLFVQVRIAISEPTCQLTIPDTAIQYDQIGPYVLVVDNRREAVLKRITLGTLEQGMRAVSQGLTAQDEVIVEGLQNATPGKPVTLRQAA